MIPSSKDNGFLSMLARFFLWATLLLAGIPAQAAVTNVFNFANTLVTAPSGPVVPSGSAISINGTNLNLGDLVVFDGIISDVPGSTTDAWGAVELNYGTGYLGVVNATLGVLVETATSGTNQCQYFINGASTGSYFGNAPCSRTNRVQIQLTCKTAGSTTNMNYLIRIDQGLNGYFSAIKSGTGMTFASNTIALTFGANNQSHQFIQTSPFIAISGPSIASSTVAAGIPASLAVNITQGYPVSTVQQWYSNGIPIPNATNLNYSTPPVDSSYNGAQYYVVVTNLLTAGNIVTSSNVTLTVRTTPGIVPFLFSTNSIPNSAQINPLNPPSIINGSSLLAGDTVVFDGIVAASGPLTGSYDGWCGIDFAAASGTPSQALGGTFALLARLGSGASQLFINGSPSSGNNPAPSGALTNRAHVEFYPSATGSTTNMGWMVELDENLTGTFLPAVRGTNLTFASNSIPLSFGAYSVSGLITPYPVGALLAVHQRLYSTNLIIGSVDQVAVTADYINVSNFALAPSTPGLIYSSSNPGAVTVSSNGYLQAVGIGSATIMSSLPGLAASNTVTVIDPGVLQSVSFSVTSPMPLYSNQTAVFVGTFANVSNINLFKYGQTTFTMNNTNIVTISPAGLITAIAPGSVVINALNSGLTSPPVQLTVTFPTNRFIFDTFGDGFWKLVNQGNSNSLVINSNGASQAVSTNTAFDQQFELLYNYQNCTFRIRNRTTGQCLAAKPGNLVGTGVIPVNYTGTPAQQWYLVDAGNGYFRLVNSAYSLVLQTDNGNPAVVTLVNASSSLYQLWNPTYQAHYPKKGCAGYDNMASALQLGWVYNYDDHYSSTLTPSQNYVPMIYAAQYYEPLSDAQNRDSSWIANPEPNYLMTYNEPDNTASGGGSNTGTNDAIGAWPYIQALNLPLVSPATQNTFDSWAYSFFALIAANNYRVDYTAVHQYVPPNAGSLMGTLQSAYYTWGRPVWLTEFSPVDWSNTRSWSENDDYNFLAEFMWEAEFQDWFKRYSIFPFAGTNSASPWVDNGYTGTFFYPDYATLTPYGELYATWDGDTNLDSRTPYILHHLGTSFRLTDTNTSSAPLASTIYNRNATTEWGLLPAPATNHYYIVSLNDGRRLQDISGSLNLAAYQTSGSTVEWEFNGPDGSGYFFITNTSGHCLTGSGTPPAISFGTTTASTQNNNTRWRLVKPYQPVPIVTAVPPVAAISYLNPGVVVSWSGNGSFYNVYRSLVPGGPYTKVYNLTTNTSYTDSNVVTGTNYYYVVTELNILGEESAYSAPVIARPPSSTVPALGWSSSFSGGSNILHFQWPADHTGWRLTMNTNSLYNPGAWLTVPNSTSTNQISMAIDPGQTNVFFRLALP